MANPVKAAFKFGRGTVTRTVDGNTVSRARTGGYVLRPKSTVRTKDGGGRNVSRTVIGGGMTEAGKNITAVLGASGVGAAGYAHGRHYVPRKQTKTVKVKVRKGMGVEVADSAFGEVSKADPKAKEKKYTGMAQASALGGTAAFTGLGVGGTVLDNKAQRNALRQRKVTEAGKDAVKDYRESRARDITNRQPTTVTSSTGLSRARGYVPPHSAQSKAKFDRVMGLKAEQIKLGRRAVRQAKVAHVLGHRGTRGAVVGASFGGTYAALNAAEDARQERLRQQRAARKAAQQSKTTSTRGAGR